MSRWWMNGSSAWHTKTEPAWEKAAGSASSDAVMSWTTSQDFHVKQGRSTGKVVIASGLPIYLKRHWHLPLWQRLLAWWRPRSDWSPAAVEWTNLQWASQQGFNVPEPLAMGQRITQRCQVQSYLAIRELTGMLPLHQAIPLAHSLQTTERFAQWKAQLLADVAGMTRRLHHLKHYHKDLYLCHFYVAKPSSASVHPGELALIDLHRLREHRWWSLYPQIKDLAQLYFSTWGVEGLDDDDRLALMKSYFGSRRWNWLQQMIYHAAVTKARRYAKHNRTSLTKIEETNRPTEQSDETIAGQAA